MKAICFVGLTINANEAREILDIEYLNPVQAGDIPTAIAEYNPELIGIIDGFFHTTASVLHKDILFALSQGIQVIGAASIGALRASELQGYGMLGCGRIFQDYLCGNIVGDDEVAVPVFYSPKEKNWLILDDCESLVNIRSTLNNAVFNGLIEEELKNAVISHAKKLSFFQRKWSVLLDHKLYDYQDDPFVSLRKNLKKVRVDQKKEDAIELLNQLKIFSDNPEKSQKKNNRLSPEGFFWGKTLYSRPLTVKNIDRSHNIPLLQDLLDYAVLTLNGSSIFKDSFIRTLLLEIASTIGIKCKDEDIEKCLNSFGNNIEKYSQLTPLTNSELYELATDEVACEYLYDLLIEKIQRGILLTLLSENKFHSYKKELMKKWHKKEFYQNNENADNLLNSYLKSQKIDNIEDYYERNLSWLPLFRIINILKNI